MGLQNPAAARILGIGVATMDIYPFKGRMYPGGNELNVSCNAGILGAEAGFMGAFGDDLIGRLLEETLEKLNIDISMCRHLKGESGYSIVQLKEDGDRVFLDWNKEGVTDLYPFEFNETELNYISGFDIVCIGRLSDVGPDKIRLMHERNINIEYDFHQSFTDSDIDLIAPMVDYGFFSLSGKDLFQKKRILKRACEKGIKIAVGTSGKDDIYLYDGTDFFVQTPFRVEAKDALGAGDSFIGAFLSFYLGDNMDLPHKERIGKSLEMAARHSSYVVGLDGSIGIGYDIKDFDEMSLPTAKLKLQTQLKSG